MTVERDWFWFWFYYALWLASVFTLVLVLRQSSENRSIIPYRFAYSTSVINRKFPKLIRKVRSLLSLSASPNVKLFIKPFSEYSRTPLFQTRLIRSPRYFEGRSNPLGFTLPLYASPVISKPRHFDFFFISLGTSK